MDQNQDQKQNPQQAPHPFQTPPDSLRAWRRRLRRSLLDARAQLPPATHAQRSAQAIDRLTTAFPAIMTGILGVYWPMLGEIDPGPLVERLRAAGGRAALPAVLEKNQPLVFLEWAAHAPLGADICGIRCPENASPVVPDTLLVPLVGFDENCFRLGYGGGYYDRTLAALTHKPRTIGIGFEAARVETISPQPYDIPLDFIVTEAALRQR